ncbi:MAG TPA: hypothetical protein VM142_04170 [Acidimicrobiales bacterium]|nr:hypothetical protein [Acidimicrobiales bacterium]
MTGARHHRWEELAPLAQRHRFMHWLTAFPHVLARDHPGFDAVVGNPPWEEVTVEALAFLGLFRPGLRSLPEAERDQAVALLLAERPALGDRLASAQERSAAERAYLGAAGYPSMPGDPDLYKYFCARYQALLRDGGRLGGVLPRSAFSASGSGGFRSWLFEETSCHRLDFLVNSGRWAFDSEPRYTVALVAAERAIPAGDHRTAVAGTASSLTAWETQAAAPGLALAQGAFGPGRTVPLLRSQAEAELLAKLVTTTHTSPAWPSNGSRGCGRPQSTAIRWWRCRSGPKLPTRRSALWPSLPCAVVPYGSGLGHRGAAGQQVVRAL